MKLFDKLIGWRQLRNVLLIMNLTGILLFLSLFSVSAGAFSQERISIQKTNTTIDELVDAIEKQTDYQFFYNSSLSNQVGSIDIDIKDATITAFLKELSLRTHLEYGIKDQIVILKEAKKTIQNTVTIRQTLSGTIRDSKTGEALIGASVAVKGTSKGAVVDVNGNFDLELEPGKYTLVISYIGYKTKKISIEVLPGQNKEIDITLDKEVSSMDLVTVVGSRTTPRTTMESPVPIDNISATELSTSGQNVLDQQLMFKVPSYNATQQPISDAAAHFSPAGLRGLLPSRTLVLVNGKRKNSSALVYSYVTPGRGEVGVDMKAIPTAAIDRVEILRDGAAAQYGSDAVAGVINLVLKKKSDPFINMGYNVTSEGDGQQYNFDTGFGVDILDKGYANFTFSYIDQQRTQRAGEITSLEDEANYWGVTETSDYSLSDLDGFLTRNPSAGFQVGLPDMTITSFAYNTGYTLREESNTEIYSFGTLTNRTGSAPQFARVPYWVPGFQAIYPNQEFFLAEMAPQILDNTFSLGFRSDFNDWNFDLSSTLGKNRIDYYIINSFNQSFAGTSPSNFYNGAHEFSHIVNNLDVSRAFKPAGIKALTLAFGAEHRTENFKIEAGEFASYGDGGSPDAQGDRTGSESFPGFKPENASNNYRSNLGFYTELTTDITDAFLIGGATRFENYSDFGQNISWKLNSRVKLYEDKINVRASVSNGFRAPSLHQIYYTAVTTTLTENGVVQNGILENENPALRALGIPRLQAETSFNVGAGLTYRITDNIGLTADVYQITVEDRIVLSGQVTATGDPASPIDQVLSDVGVGSAGFFLNAIDTKTQGLDIVLTFDDITAGKGYFEGSISANFNETTVESINLPNFIVENDLENNIFSREDVSRMETWRPQEKVVGTVTYNLDKFSTSLSSLYYGAVTYLSNNEVDDATYSGKTIVNLSVSYEMNDNVQFTLGVNNIANVYPDTFSEAYSDREGHPIDRNLDFVGRFKYPWQTTQFGIDGRRYFADINFRF
ncbi:TonB-dependent receptor [Marivirga sp. S37H4]|uniref:TonB-dependent receptor n=1 Tax=Marivirga aurantiaca TaxID=2802615 RepID=A0A934WW63_9BACT|nr:TonB-dependent receptor [Marivirga aurantiaca]MBK6264016.1 TonB-dependent receptor [Marivirga aurantiaca]